MAGDTLRILFVGDVISKPGRWTLSYKLPRLREELSLDLIIVNGENAAGGFGLNRKTAEEIFQAGADLITLGNHTWDEKEIVELLEENERIIRPANIHKGPPGKGFWVDRKRSVGVVNLQGQVFMNTRFCPFYEVDQLLREELAGLETIIVDFHAEATAEKATMAFMLDGRVTAVIGTHTHVQTNDARILPGGTFFITDVGMCGALNSIIGMKPKRIIEGVFQPWKFRMEVARSFPYLFNAVFLEVRSGKVFNWKVINEVIEEGSK